MTLADDLRAAKGLIDTPEKLRETQFGVIGALSDVCPEEEGVTDADQRYNAMRAALIHERGSNLHAVNRLDHADIMALFDRAIAAAEASK